MPAYNFKSRFADKVRSGKKRQTIRKKRKRRTLVGETVYLYTGMRTKKCERLAVGTVTKVTDILIDVSGTDVFIVLYDGKADITGHILSVDEMNDLARKDGFDTIQELAKFFRDTHGPVFNGVVIEWDVCYEEETWLGKQ